MNRKQKLWITVIMAALFFAAAGGTFAWYLREDVKQAETETAEIMAPYNLYLMNPNASDSLRFAVGNLHPGEVKHTVICVSNKVPADNAAGDHMSELVKDSEFNYELQLVHTQNLAVDYLVYPLERHDMPADESLLPAEAIRMEDDTFDLYYWTKAAGPLAGLDNSDKMQEEVFGDAAADVVNAGQYEFFGGADMKLAYTDGAYEYDYYLIEVKWQSITDFDAYKKETDLVYAVVNAKQPRPTEK